MNFRKRFACRTLLSVALFGATAGAATAGATHPEAVSPGELDRPVEMRDGCFGYSWASVDDALAFELAVYRTEQDASGAEPSAPALSVRVPAALSWAPSLEKCLPPGRYAWVVCARTAAGWTGWSEPRLFAVPRAVGGPPQEKPSTAASLDGHSQAIAEPRSPASELRLRPAPSSPRPLFAEAFTPPVPDGSLGAECPLNDLSCAWFQQAYEDGIFTSCGTGLCLDNPVTRRQLAMYLERAMRGTDSWRPEQGDGAVPNLPPAPAGFNSPDTTGNVGGYTSITLGADGLALISYLDFGNGDLKVAHCQNTNCTAATVTPLDTTGAVGYFTAITLGADRLGLISYAELSGGLKVAHCSNVNCTAATITPLDAHSFETSITVGADGLGLISYQDSLTADLKVAHCSNPACTAATITPLDTTGAVGAFSSIAIGADGLGLISYLDNSTVDLKVAHCSDTNCTAATITPLDTTDDVGWFTSLTIGADGLGLIAYVDDTIDDLKVAHCSDIDCTAATITTLDTASNLNSYLSLTIGADGLGLISYLDADSASLKVAHCSNTNCTAAALTSVDPVAFGIGAFSAITIGADGLGLISYYDATNGDLKVAHCSNVLCTPYFRRR